jgi:hypothetical protein
MGRHDPIGSLRVPCSTKFGIRKLCVSLLLLTACDAGSVGSGPTEADAATTGDPPAADSGRPEEEAPVFTEPLTAGEWDGLDLDARRQFMREMVMPAMRRAFADFDSERFASLGCRTCHGGGTSDGTFAMPSSDLPVLTSASLMNPDPADQAITEFMRSVVRPQMAMLLGAEATGPAAVRCATCHMIQQ